MTRRLVLEAFDSAATPAAQDDGAAEAALEQARLAGYDAGYKSGWDDAIRKAREDGEHIGAEFARNLRDLGFTYEEARAHVMRSLEGFLSEICETFLPAAVSESLAPVVVETLSELAADAAGTPVLIRVSPENAERLRALVSLDAAVPAQIVEEPTLAEGQAYLKLGAEERVVDLAEPLERVRTAIRAIGNATERTLDARNTA